MNKKDLTNTWEATQLRITLFPQESFSGNVIDLLPKIEGLVTNQITTQPQSLEQVIESTIDNYKLILTALPIKLDLVLIPGEGLEGQAPSVGLLRLGNFSEVVKKFSEINELWIKQLKIKEFNRVALGTQIVYEVKDRVNGYKKLSGLLPFQLKAEEFSDFSLQINKPHKYKFISRELNINRLIKWSVLRLNFGIQSVGDPKTQHKFPDQNYCSIVMDINTQPEQGKFNNEDATKLINNFIKLSMEISEQGLK